MDLSIYYISIAARWCARFIIIIIMVSSFLLTNHILLIIFMHFKAGHVCLD